MKHAVILNGLRHRATVAALVALAVVPLLWPLVPPLVDLPGHMGRYAIQLNYDAAPHLRQWYAFDWALIGNLGVDLLIIPISSIFGIELGTKLIVIAIIASTTLGLLSISREVHGRITPTALFALPFAYGHPFMFGFVNYALSMALALCAFALWLCMARQGASRRRPFVFLPVSIMLWLCHAYGWAFLGILAFSAELVRQWDRRDERPSRWQVVVAAAWRCLPMALPMMLMIIWRSGAVGGATTGSFDGVRKLLFVLVTLRDRWAWFDLGALTIVIAMLTAGVLSSRLQYSRTLGVAAILIGFAYLALPAMVFGSDYADMRLTPYFFALALVGIRPSPDSSSEFRAILAVAGAIFFAARMGGTTISFAKSDRELRSAVGALEHVPVGARLVSFVGNNPCSARWLQNRFAHLPGLALVRRQAFSNDQWDLPGAQLLRVKPGAMGRFASDSSQVVAPYRCADPHFHAVQDQLRALPRNAFDDIWLIQADPIDAQFLRGTSRVWTDGWSALYRIDRDSS